MAQLSGGLLESTCRFRDWSPKNKNVSLFTHIVWNLYEFLPLQNTKDHIYIYIYIYKTVVVVNICWLSETLRHIEIYESQFYLSKLSVSGVIIVLCMGEFLGEVSTWMEMGSIPLLLGEDSTHACCRSINTDSELISGSWFKLRSGREGSFSRWMVWVASGDWDRDLGIFFRSDVKGSVIWL